jgi:hypothetical protein
VLGNRLQGDPFRLTDARSHLVRGLHWLPRRNWPQRSLRLYILRPCDFLPYLPENQ